MTSLKEGQDKLREICDALKKDTLEPAREEAVRIINEAEERAQEIIEKGKQQAEKIIEDARESMKRERNVFDSSLAQATKLALESLRQAVERKLFNEQLTDALDKPLTNPSVIADLITGLIKAIEKEGLSTDLSAAIPKIVSVDAVNALLLKELLTKLREKSVVLGPFGGGVAIKLHDKKIVVDMTDATLKELLANYIRKDFRKLIFGE